MRPTVSEQLEGACRILEQDVNAALGQEHTRETVRNLVANLRMLARNWPRLLPFLLWDNTQSALLLGTAREHVDGVLRQRIDDCLAAAPAEVADVERVEAWNDDLRACLSACIAGGCPVTLLADMRTHLAERARRYPLRVTGAQPKPRDAAARGDKPGA